MMEGIDTEDKELHFMFAYSRFKARLSGHVVFLIGWTLIRNDVAQIAR